MTILHHSLNFDEAEKTMTLHNLSNGIVLKLVSYDFLKEAKLYAQRPKDLWDITQLEKLRNSKQ